jgi:epsilon-lactone hydrolase
MGMATMVHPARVKRKGRSGMAVMHQSQDHGGRAVHNRRMHDDAAPLAFPRAPDAIELRHLRAFVAVAEELNFGRAAAQLYVSQPALSRQIRALERLVGCELLRRSTHRVELTLAGESLLDRARKLLGDLDEAVTVTQSVGGELARRTEEMWRPLADLTAGGAELEALREAYEALHAQFGPPQDVVVRPVSAGGVPSLIVSPDGADAPTLLYLHGGGYVMGSAFGYRHLCGALAVAAGAAALVPDYRLAPEHPYPAGLDDAVRAYKWMLERGVEPGRITVAGDSSGGGLTMSLLLALMRDGLPLPGGAALLCPGVDLSNELLAKRSSASEPQPVMALEIARSCAAAYLGDHPLEDPVISPLLADLAGLPPLLIQGATGDDRCDEAQALAARAVEHGVDARLELFPVAAHVFHVFWTFLPEATEALDHAGRFAAAIGERPAAAAAG